MLKKYIKINGEQLPNPVEYSEEFSKISNEFQSEAGDDLVVDVRSGKYSGNMTFHVSSRWKDKLTAYANLHSFKLEVDGKAYQVRIKSISHALENNSEYAENTQGYWNVSFTAGEL